MFDDCIITDVQKREGGGSRGSGGDDPIMFDDNAAEEDGKDFIPGELKVSFFSVVKFFIHLLLRLFLCLRRAF